MLASLRGSPHPLPDHVGPALGSQVWLAKLAPRGMCYLRAVLQKRRELGRWLVQDSWHSLNSSYTSEHILQKTKTLCKAGHLRPVDSNAIHSCSFSSVTVRQEDILAFIYRLKETKLALVSSCNCSLASSKYSSSPFL